MENQVRLTQSKIRLPGKPQYLANVWVSIFFCSKHWLFLWKVQKVWLGMVTQACNQSIWRSWVQDQTEPHGKFLQTGL